MPTATVVLRKDASDSECKSSQPKVPKGGKGAPSMGKPVMRNIHHVNSLRNVYTALALSGLSGTLFYFLFNRRHKAAYRDFYSTYDAEASFNRMVEAGVLDSCKAPPPKKK